MGLCRVSMFEDERSFVEVPGQYSSKALLFLLEEKSELALRLLKDFEDRGQFEVGRIELIPARIAASAVV